jgi:hypothetical protein
VPKLLIGQETEVMVITRKAQSRQPWFFDLLDEAC